MDICRMLTEADAPNVPLEDIIVHDIKEKRLIKLLTDNGIRTTGDLKLLTNEDLRKKPMIWFKKIQKLKDMFEAWIAEDFPTRNYISVTRPGTIRNSLEANVFGNYTNLDIIALRGAYQTYEYIGEKYNQTRQGIFDRENRVYRKFLSWYEAYRVAEKIGDFDDFNRYCETNFPEDQRAMKIAVSYLTTLAKKKQPQN